MTHGPDFFEECAERIFQEFTRFLTSLGIISKLSNLGLFGTFSLIALSGALYIVMRLYRFCYHIINMHEAAAAMHAAQGSLQKYGIIWVFFPKFKTKKSALKSP